MPTANRNTEDKYNYYSVKEKINEMTYNNIKKNKNGMENTNCKSI